MNVWNMTESAAAINLTNIIRIDNRYYCFFEKNVPNYDKKGYFFIMKENGIIEKNISITEEIYDSYYGVDLFLRNDSILVKTGIHTNEATYYFDRNKLIWEQIEEADDVVYEDEMYYVTARRNRMWFRDKSDGKEYELGYLFSPIVNSVNGRYYITTVDQVLQIDDPRDMKLCDPRDYYDIVKQQKWNYRGSDSFTGTRAIYKDSTYLDQDRHTPRISILTSFVYESQLLHLCVNSESTFIARLENDQLIPIQNVGPHYHVILYYNGYRMENQKKCSHILLFWDEDKGSINISGFIEIIGNRVNIRYLNQC